MSIETSFEPGGNGRDSVATIRLDGGQDVFRFASNMLEQQVEFMVAGRTLLVELREHLTPERFDPMARSLLGEALYERRRTYFERDTYCAACEEEFEPGQPYAPIKNAKALCKPCAEDNAVLGLTFVKAPGEPTPAVVTVSTISDAPAVVSA